jgi:nitric oxide reductase activation protein
VFYKRIKPDEKNDFAVAIAIDESGSMGAYCSNGKRRSELARETVIAFAEIFNKLNIPVYIMGFSADEKGYDTTHYHYVTWKNTKMDRYALLNVTNRSDNRDGPSIRYLTKILDDKEAKHKLLIVISDGAPAAYHYENGDADTAKAVRDAARKFPVFGVSIGNANEELLASFYKQHFIVVKQGEDDLFASLAKKIKKLLK